MSLSLKQRLAQALPPLWYRPRTDLPLWAWSAWPLAQLYRGVVAWRRAWLQSRVVSRLAVPVIVVGNLTVGGTGKTPLIIALAAYLRAHGWRPGIVLRGYGAAAARSCTPCFVTPESDVSQVGDEAVLLAQQTACPVVVGARRYAAAQILIEQADCDVVLSDDGLQHYALPRDIEIAVIDGMRQFGNGFCLPLGPLREPLVRLAQVDFRVCTDGVSPDATTMRIVARSCRRVIDDAPIEWSELQSRPLTAVAGIGNPQRFFASLAGFGLAPATQAFPDHHAFCAADFASLPKDSYVLMTYKDAVKCRAFADARFVYVDAVAELPVDFLDAVQARLRTCLHPSVTTDLDRCNV